MTIKTYTLADENMRPLDDNIVTDLETAESLRDKMRMMLPGVELHVVNIRTINSDIWDDVGWIKDYEPHDSDPIKWRNWV